MRLCKEMLRNCVLVKGKMQYFIALTVFWLVMVMIRNPLEYSDYENCGVYTERLGGNGVGATAVLETGTEIAQSFQASRDGLREVKLCAATYLRSNNCTVRIAVEDAAGTVIYKGEFDASEWTDDWYTFEFESQTESKGEAYTIKLYGVDGMAENSPSMWYTGEVSENESYMEINGETQEDCALLLQTV